MGGSLAWAIIAGSGLPGFLKGLLGLVLCVGLGWVLLRSVKKREADLFAENVVFGVGVESGASVSKPGTDRDDSSVG